MNNITVMNIYRNLAKTAVKAGQRLLRGRQTAKTAEKAGAKPGRARPTGSRTTRSGAPRPPSGRTSGRRRGPAARRTKRARKSGGAASELGAPQKALREQSLQIPAPRGLLRQVPVQGLHSPRLRIPHLGQSAQQFSYLKSAMICIASVPWTTCSGHSACQQWMMRHPCQVFLAVV